MLVVLNNDHRFVFERNGNLQRQHLISLVSLVVYWFTALVKPSGQVMSRWMVDGWVCVVRRL
jgi:hypothetical protein